jgi:hypothetical protein
LIVAPGSINSFVLAVCPTQPGKNPWAGNGRCLHWNTSACKVLREFVSGTESRCHIGFPFTYYV